MRRRRWQLRDGGGGAPGWAGGGRCGLPGGGGAGAGSERLGHPRARPPGGAAEPRREGSPAGRLQSLRGGRREGPAGMVSPVRNPPAGPGGRGKEPGLEVLRCGGPGQVGAIR